MLQNNQIIPKEYSVSDFYRDVEINMCPDENVSQEVADILKKNLIIKHDYSESENKSEIAFNGVNIIIFGDNVEILGELDKSLPTILLYKENSKYYVIYEKNNGIFNTNSKFIKGLVS